MSDVYAQDLDEPQALADAIHVLLGRQTVRYDGMDVPITAYPGWPDGEDPLAMPAAVVGPIDGEFRYHGFAPILVEGTARPYMAGQEIALSLIGEYVATASIEVWAQTAELRSATALAIMDALMDIANGSARRTIGVPRYYGGAVQADVQPIGSAQQDIGDDVLQRTRIQTVRVSCIMPAIRPVPVRDLALRFRLDIE